VRKVEATELIALDVCNSRQITLGDVEHYISRLRGHPAQCPCGRCSAAAIVASRSGSDGCAGMAASGPGNQGA
jgi:hypothetical protein